ncbi:MAG: 4Fe-4S cluster-binding domain-containing protein [Lachnospiraceae bacterium]
MLNGDGLRVVLWVSGCSHHCPECQNRWRGIEGRTFVRREGKRGALLSLQSRIFPASFSGGDPLHQR